MFSGRVSHKVFSRNHLLATNRLKESSLVSQLVNNFYINILFSLFSLLEFYVSMRVFPFIKFQHQSKYTGHLQLEEQSPSLNFMMRNYLTNLERLVSFPFLEIYLALYNNSFIIFFVCY